MKRKSFATIPAKSASPGEAGAMISTADLDRDHDRLLPQGVRLEGYKKNPVVLFGHSQRDLPVARATSVEVVPDRGIHATWKWLQGDEFAGRVANAWEQKALSATSVGFLPLQASPNQDGGLDFAEWELLEFSIVPVPANPNALRVLRSLGLDGERGVQERPPRRLVERIWGAAPAQRSNLGVRDDAAHRRWLDEQARREEERLRKYEACYLRVGPTAVPRFPNQ